MGLDDGIQALSADLVAEALLKAGYTVDQIQASTGKYAEALYEEEYFELDPEFIMESDLSVDLYDPTVKADIKHPLRIMNKGDFWQAMPVIYEIARGFGKRERKTAEEVLMGSNPEQFLADLFQRLQAFKTTGKYPMWAIAAMNLIGQIASTPERTITARTLIALPSKQHDELIIKLWQVNRQSFFDWLGYALPGLLPTISTVESKIGLALKKLNQIGQKEQENTSGGAESIGSAPSSAPSKKRAGSKKALALTA